jgi:hypothetical protein
LPTQFAARGIAEHAESDRGHSGKAAAEPADAGAMERRAAYGTKLKDGRVRAQRKQRYLQDVNVAQQDVMNNLGRDEDLNFHFPLSIA